MTEPLRFGIVGCGVIGPTHADSLQALKSEGVELAAFADRIAGRGSVSLVGSGYGVPVALEIALKLKEASYVHAEGFAAGEFRHGSTAMLDATATLLGIVDDASAAIVGRTFAGAARSGALLATIGGPLEALAAYGPTGGSACGVLGALVAGQVLALETGRARGIDGDAPRGLTKYVT
ncbi:MAG: hypothetical protein NVSMB21_13940 [Vulcanimicrobiaceae bacterium]